MILQTLRIVHASGAYLRRQAQALAQLVGGAPGRGVRRRIIDGYLIQSRKVSDKAVTTTIQDLPGTVIGYNDPYTEKNGRPVEQYTSVGPRDDFIPNQALPASFEPLAPDPSADVREPEFGAILNLGAIPAAMQAYITSPADECGPYLCRALLLSDRPIKSIERGIAVETQFCARFTVRWSQAPSRAFAVQLSESYMQAKVGYHMVARNIDFMEYQVASPSFPVCAFDGKSLFIAMQGIIDGKQPAQYSMLDAGARALLIARLDLVFQDDVPVAVTWGWHYLYELTKSDFPSCKVGRWEPFQDAFGWSDESMGAPRLVGNMQNTFEEVKLSLSGTGKLAVFAITRVLLPGYPPASQGPEVFCASSLLSFTADMANTTPVVMPRLVDFDVVASKYATPYASLQVNRPDQMRTFSLWGAFHLDDQPRAVVSGVLMRRTGDPEDYPMPSGRSEWRQRVSGYYQLVSDDLGYISVFDDRKLLATGTARELGAIKTFPTYSGGVHSYELMNRFRSLRSASKTSDRTLAIIGYAYPYTNLTNPGLRLLQYTEGSGFSSLGSIAPSEGEGGTASQTLVPTPSCYQQALYNDKGQELRSAGLLLSYYGAGSQRSYLSRDGGTRFTEYIKFGCSHGVYYLGSPVWTPEYGHPFTK